MTWFTQGPLFPALYRLTSQVNSSPLYTSEPNLRNINTPPPHDDIRVCIIRVQGLRHSRLVCMNNLYLPEMKDYRTSCFWYHLAVCLSFCELICSKLYFMVKLSLSKGMYAGQRHILSSGKSRSILLLG